MHGELIVQFESSKQTLLFHGVSRLRENLADEVYIYDDKIVVSFDRAKPADIHTCLFSPKSLFRYEMQKSLCFYLAVTGSLPRTKEIILQGDHGKQIISELPSLEKWNKCSIDRVLAPSVITRIFELGPEAKAIYIALTYYLKAQLDSFSHDCFRAAWSGLNVLYTAIAPDKANSERDKLKNLREYFEKDTLKPVCEYVRCLDDDFWDKLDWYSYTRKQCYENNGKVKSMEKAKERLFLLEDSMLISKMAGYMRSTVYTGQKGNYGDIEDYEHYRKQIEKAIRKNGESCSARARFLITGYCYMIRNRSFHAEKAYPLFEFHDRSEEKTIEERLTELILMTIEGLMMEL